MTRGLMISDLSHMTNDDQHLHSFIDQSVSLKKHFLLLLLNIACLEAFFFSYVYTKYGSHFLMLGTVFGERERRADALTAAAL